MQSWCSEHEQMSPDRSCGSGFLLLIGCYAASSLLFREKPSSPISQHGASADWGNMIVGMGRLISRRRGFVHDGLGAELKSRKSFDSRPLAQFICVTRRHSTTQYITSLRYWGRFDTPSCLLRPLEFVALAQTNIESLKANPPSTGQ